jgi:hypothetical protein
MVRSRQRSLVVAAVLALGAGACAHTSASAGAPPAAPVASSDGSHKGDGSNGDVLVFVPDPKTKPAGDRPWGAPVPDPAVEKAVSALLSAVGDGKVEAGRFASPLAVGPALWKILGELDAGLANAGKPSFALIPHPGSEPEKLDMRAFFDAADVATLLRSPAFRKIGRAFASAKIRPADDAERQLFYAFIPWELVGRPVTIAERGKDRLLVYVDEQGRPTWIDVVSAYNAPSPPAS